MRPPRLLAAVLLAGLLCAGGARAADEKDQQAADALFKEGRAAADQRDYETACARFRESDRLDPALGTKFNLADCEEHLGHLEAARAMFVEVAQQFPAGDDRLPIAQRRAAALEKRMPKIVVRLAPGTRASIARDGRALADSQLGAAMPVSPGHHTVLVTAPGREPRIYEVDAKEGEVVELTVTVGAAAAPALTASAVPSATAEVSDTSSLRRTLGFVAGGAGIAGIGVGIITGAVAIADKAVVDSSCHGTNVCDDKAGVGAAAEGRVVSAVSTVSFAVGAVALAAGIVLVLTSKGPTKTVIAPAASPQGAGFMLRSSF